MKRRTLNLWIIRSGETPWDAEGRLYGGEDLPLSEAGRLATLEAIDRTASIERVRPRTIHHAPDEAAKETAGLIASRLKARRRVAHDLAEPELGVLAGLSVEELRERFERRARQWEEDPSELVPPEGEPFEHARRRVTSEACRILKRTRTDVLGMVMHDFAAGFLRSSLSGNPTGNPRRWMQGRPRIESWVVPANATERLQELLKQMPTP